MPVLQFPICEVRIRTIAGLTPPVFVAAPCAVAATKITLQKVSMDLALHVCCLAQDLLSSFRLPSIYAPDSLFLTLLRFLCRRIYRSIRPAASSILRMPASTGPLPRTSCILTVRTDSPYRPHMASVTETNCENLLFSLFYDELSRPSAFFGIYRDFPSNLLLLFLVLAQALEALDHGLVLNAPGTSYFLSELQIGIPTGAKVARRVNFRLFFPSLLCFPFSFLFSLPYTYQALPPIFLHLLHILLCMVLSLLQAHVGCPSPCHEALVAEPECTDASSISHEVCVTLLNTLCLMFRR